jgi:hypothetical protein
MTASSPEAERGTLLLQLRVVVYVVLGLVAVDAVVAAYAPVWASYDPEEYRERLEACRRRPHDLVVVGGSTVGEGIDPAVLAGTVRNGYQLDRVFALGMPGATTSEVWHGVEHGLPTPPHVLVYGITASDLNDGRHEPEGARHLMSVGDVLACTDAGVAARSARHWTRSAVGRLWNLHRYRNGIRLWAADRFDGLWPGTFADAAAEAHTGLAFSAALRRGDGFAPRPDAQLRRLDELKAGGSLGPPFHFLDKYRIGGEHTTCLNRLLAWADTHGVELILVDMPVSADLDGRLHPSEFAAFRRFLSELERDRRVRVLRATREAVGLTDADFADVVHLNGSGTSKLSRWLRRSLETN